MNTKQHYLLIKREGFRTDGKALTAHQSALALLEAGIWPLWEHTRNRRAMKAGDEVAIYLSGRGNQVVIASAIVTEIGPWEGSIARRYPLLLDGTPFAVLHLSKKHVFQRPIKVAAKLNSLSFVKKDDPKWGVAFMGGTRALSSADFDVLTNPEVSHV